jgi:ATP-dependent protease ClpP protease subunit
VLALAAEGAVEQFFLAAFGHQSFSAEAAEYGLIDKVLTRRDAA